MRGEGVLTRVQYLTLAEGVLGSPCNRNGDVG